MDQTENYMAIMEASLEKKIKILEQIVFCTDRESQVLAASDFQMDQLNKCLKDKEPLIEELVQLDDGFVALFEKIKPIIENNRQEFKNQIDCMKENISKITELSVKIQSQEIKNKSMAEKNFGVLKSNIKRAKHSGTTVSNYYKSASVMSGDAYFIDKKE